MGGKSNKKNETPWRNWERQQKIKQQSRRRNWKGSRKFKQGASPKIGDMYI